MSIVFAVGGLSVTLADIYFNMQPGKYESEHIRALAEIADILRLRGHGR